MRVHKLFCAAAVMALLGTPAMTQEGPWSVGLNLRGAIQPTSREDNLKPVYMGFGVEVGYKLDWGNLSAEAGFLYKPGDQYLYDISKMNYELWAPDPSRSVDSRKNKVEGITLRLAYEKPLERFSVKGGLMLGQLKYKQEVVGHVESGWQTVGGEQRRYIDAYNDVPEKGNLSISPFVGINFPFLDHMKIELNLVALNYKNIDYHHVAGTVWAEGPYQTTKDYMTESSRFIPHLEVTFGFRF